MLAPSAIRRASDWRTVRTIARLAGTPLFVKPARVLVRCSVRPYSVRARFGNSRSSKKICMNSSRDSEKTNESSLSPSPPLPLPPPPPPPCGRAIRSPATYSRLPGSTNSRSPPGEAERRPEMSFNGTRTSPPAHVQFAFANHLLTAAWMCDRSARKYAGRRRLPRLEVGDRQLQHVRNSVVAGIRTTWTRRYHSATGAPVSPVALRDHPGDEILVLLARRPKPSR